MPILLANKESFERLKPKKCYLIYLLMIVLLMILICLLNYKIYDNYQTKGYVVCDNDCYLNIAIPTSVPLNKLYVNLKEIKYEVKSKELKIDEENLISYYEYQLKSPKFTQNDEIFLLTLYYNKQRIFDKLTSKLF